MIKFIGKIGELEEYLKSLGEPEVKIIDLIKGGKK